MEARGVDADMAQPKSKGEKQRPGKQEVTRAI